MPGRGAILMVNGFDRRSSSVTEAVRYPWIDLSLREVVRRSNGADYQVHVWDNVNLAQHRRMLNANKWVRVWHAGPPGRTLPHPMRWTSWLPGPIRTSSS
jgi:hypothetical protein